MKPQQIYLKLLIITSSFLLTNCFFPPEAIIKLKPESEKMDWYKGKEIVTLDNDSITIHISYDRNINKDYVFDVDVTNNSQNTVLVEPEKFSYLLKKGSIKYGDTLKSVYAKDPEKVILELQKANSIHQSNMQTQAMVYSLGYFLQFAGQTKALVTGDAELSERIDDQTRRTKENELIDDISNNRISESLNNSSYIWEILALRKTTLYPNESISGKVFFPVDEWARTIELSFPIDRYDFKIIYNQTLKLP